MQFANPVMSLFAAPPTIHRTPTDASSRDRGSQQPGLSMVEKHAMIDDLQLEISKRARSLRSIYNEQARQLRETLERRLHRIPPRMRSQTMGELADEQTRKIAASQATTTTQTRATAQPRGVKRNSDAAFVITGEDKENAASYPELNHEKKRPRTAKPQVNDHSTAVSKANILSPRSHNSRTLPRSPIKTRSPEKVLPTSKLAGPGAHTTAPKPRPVSRAVSRQGTTAARKPVVKKTIADSVDDGRESEGSATSTGTTIVKKPSETASKRTTTRKAATKASTTSIRKRPATTTKTDVAPAAAATRTLRKRG